LGFSQGVATISRWVENSDVNFDHLVLWAGEFPSDIEKLEKFKTTNVHFLYGDSDRFISESAFQKQDDDLKKVGLTFQIIRFQGDHSIDPVALKQLSQKISG
jgi:predicted esterase